MDNRTPRKANGPAQAATLPFVLQHSRLIIVLLTFVLYGNTLKNQYALDDELNTHLNAQVARGFSAIPEIMTSVYYQEEGNAGKLSFGYRPVAKVTFAIEAGLFGSNPKLLVGASHFINILLYALTLLILLQVLGKLFRNWNPLFPFLVTLLFLAHPLHTEVVASLKNREEILSLMGGLGALYFLLVYAETLHWRQLIYSVLCFIGGYLSKSSILTFLVILPLTLYFFTRLSPKKLLVITILFVIALISTQLIPKFFLPAQIRPTEFIENPLFFDTNLMNRAGTGLVILLHYLVQLTINPANMAFYYGFDMFPVVSITHPVALISLAIHLFLMGTALWQWKQKTLISYAILFYLISISMYSNVVLPVVGMAADRFLFIPSLGYCIALAYGLWWIARRKEGKWITTQPRPAIFIPAVMVIMVVYSAITINRNSDWKDLPTLYKADIENLSRSVKANTQYAGNILYEIFNGQPPQKPTRENVQTMIRHFNLALKIKPDYYDALNSLGSIYSTMLGQQREAVALFERATQSKPEATAAFINLGYAYVELKEYDKAIDAYNTVLKLDPGRMKAIFKLAEVYEKKGDIDQAIAINQRAMQMDTTSEIPYINIGNYFLMAHDTTTAVEWWQKAVEKQPLEQLSHNLSLHFEQKGDPGKAAYYRQKAKEAKGVIIMHR